MNEAETRAGSERLGQSRLAQNGVGGVAARDADGHREIPLGDRAVPDFVAALALPDERAARFTQQIAQRPIELRRHSGCRRLGFAQSGDLQKQGCWIDAWVIVGQQVERHRRNLRQQFIERRRIGGGGDVVAMSAPDRGFIVPVCGNSEDNRFRHVGPAEGSRHIACSGAAREAA